MRETKAIRHSLRSRRLMYSIATKLICSLVGVMLVIFALLGYLNIRLHRQHLEATTLTSAQRVSDVIRRSTAYYMLRNDREGLYHTIQTMAEEPGIAKVRVFDQTGRIGYSTDPLEVNHVLDKTADCDTCMLPSGPLQDADRFRIY